MVTVGSEAITPGIASDPQGKVGEGTEIEREVETEIGQIGNTEIDVRGVIMIPGTSVIGGDQGTPTGPTDLTSTRIGRTNMRSLTRKPRRRGPSSLKVLLNLPVLSLLDQIEVPQDPGHNHRPD